jgi:hypothetical protein
MNERRTISATVRVLPPGVPPRTWLVIRPTGERYSLYKEPPEGWAVWAKGFDGIVVEYPFGAVTYTPPLKKTVPPKP